MTQKLKPCPFCLGHAKLFSDLDGHSFVSCMLCASTSDIRKDESEAVSLWNTRHEPKREFVVNPEKEE